MAKLLRIIILLLLVLSIRVEAIDMGTLAKNNFAKISVDDSAKFTVLFWNFEDGYKLELSVKESPENWTTIIEPNDFILNASTGKEYIKLPYKSESIKATPVDIIVKPNNSTKPGKYNITIAAKFGQPTKVIGFYQERIFKFVVEIENPLFFEDTKSQNRVIDQNKENQSIAKFDLTQKQEDFSINYFYLIILLLIIFVSFLIYKYS